MTQPFVLIARALLICLLTETIVFCQDLALNKTATASSQESATYAPAMAVDGNAATRWSTAFSDPQWIRVDLGGVQTVSSVNLVWEAASAKNYTIDVSANGTTWTTLATKTNMASGARTDNITGLSGSGRYIRMNGTARTTVYGYSLFTFSVYGGVAPKPGTLSLVAATYSVNENGLNVSPGVTRTNGSDGTVTVDFATSNGTAVAGQDYTAKTGTLTLGPGVTDVNIPAVFITDDALVEGNETFTIALSNPTGGAAIGSPSSSVITIIDNEQPTSIVLPGRIQAEEYKPGGEGVGYHDLTTGNTGGAYRTDNVDIQATTDAGGGYNVGWFDAGEWLAYDVNVQQTGTYKFTARVASANAGTKTLSLSVDGVALGSISFTSAAGWQSFTDAVLDNITLSAGSHVLRVTTTTGGLNFNYLDVAASTVTKPGTLQLSAATYSVAESGANASLTVNRVNGSDGSVSIGYATANGTATAGSDYTAKTGTLTFAAGVTSQTITVPITDDAAVESGETFTVTLSNATGGATIGTPSNATVTIVDNDQPGLVDLALNKPATASSQESATYAPSMAVDGNATTRWSSVFSDPQWLRVDLGAVVTVNYVKLVWEAASAKNYTIDMSNDGTAWTTVATKTSMAAGARTDSVGGLNASGRYIRMNGTSRTTAYGYSLFSFGVYGAGATLPVANAGPDRTINLGLSVTLDGSSSFDPVPGPQPLSYSWQEVSGPAVTLIGASTAAPSFMAVEQGVYTFALTVSDGSSSSTDQVSITTSFKPSAAGPYAYDRIVYATPGIDYGALAVAPILVTVNFINRYTNVTFADYQKFSSPYYQTHALDMSQFDYYGGTTFPFLNADGSNMPMNGIMYKPAGNGPFPIVFFVHGQHVPIERSDPGYETLCSLVASNGMIGVTIDENYLNDGGGNGARALMLLENIKQFRTWNQTSGHPLYQKIDMNNILIVGHSRGGEAVAIASYFNQLSNQGVTRLRPQVFDPSSPQFGIPVAIDGSGQFGPYRFAIKGVAAIAPTTGFYLPVDPADSTKNVDPRIDVPYFLISGGRDSDAGNLAGLDTYNSASPFAPAGTSDVTSAAKGHLFLHNANHNYFNTVWALSPDGSTFCSYGVCFDSTYQLSLNDQYESLKCFVGSVSQSILKGVTGYLDFFKDKTLCGATLPQNAVNARGASLPIVFNTQFQDNRRLLVNHYEEDSAPTTASKMPGGLVGTNSWSAGLTVSEQLIGSTPANDYPEHALVAIWTASGNNYTTKLSAALPTTASSGDAFKTAAVRVGFSCSETENDPALNQDFSLRLKDNAGHLYSMAASAASTGAAILPKQTYIKAGELTYAKYPAMFQTIRFPLSAFSANGVNTSAITEMAIVADKTAKGKFYIDDIQITR